VYLKLKQSKQSKAKEKKGTGQSLYAPKVHKTIVCTRVHRVD